MAQPEIENDTVGHSSYRDTFKERKISDPRSHKYLSAPVSSDGMIMRTSFKVRFEITQKKSSNAKPFIEFPVQLVYEDEQEKPVAPLEREVKERPGIVRKNTISEK